MWTLSRRHRINLDAFHYKWNNKHKPVLSIKSGDTVTCEVNDVASWQITDSWTSKDLTRLDSSKLYPLTGPIYIEGAKAGDVLSVEVVDIEVGDFGWSVILPGFGLLDEFRDNYLYKWNLVNKRFAPFEKGIKLPLGPFCGVMGVAPAEEGELEVMPPGKHGGNMDIKHLTTASRVMIPVQVDGALFSVGDIHAAMGDGEVCLSAIECPGTVSLRFEVERDTKMPWPRYTTKGVKPSRKGYFGTTGIAPDLMMATKEAVRNMIGHLSDRYGLTGEQAYVLCSVAGDVRVHEVVDNPNWVVGVMMPEDIFPE